VGALDNVAIGVGIARKGWLEADDILNARSADDVIAFAHARREPSVTPRAAQRSADIPVSDADADLPF
jgi:hypothetical protein